MNNDSFSVKTIAITLNSLWNIYNFRLSLIKDIVDAGYKVVIIAPKDTDRAKIDELGYSYVELKELSRKGQNPIQDIRLINELTKLYKKHSVDIAIHFTIKPNIYGSIAANRVGIPSIAVVTGLGYTFLSKGVSSKVAKLLYKYAFNKNSLTIFQNNDDRDLFIKKSLVKSDKSKVILGSGIDMKHFYNKNPDYTRSNQILFVGRLLQDKGVRELLEGFEAFSKNNPEVILHMIGDVDANNPASMSKEEVAGYKNKHVVFHGFQNDVRDYIKKADVVVLPSYREGLPRTMLEAIAMAKPIITTDVPGCREVVDDNKNGYLVPPYSSESINSALEKFYNTTKSQRNEMGSHSYHLASNKFSCEIVNQQYLKEIERILNN